MKKIFKNIIYFFHGLFAFNNKNKAVALMYHSVSDSNIFFAVKKENFLKQIKYIANKNYNAVYLDKLYKYIKDKNIPTKTVAVTFDDGYRDNYLNAYPILKKYNIPATVFINTSLIGSNTKARNGETVEMLNYNEIAEMRESGLIRFESHCHTHKKLVRLDEDDIGNELSLSSKIIKEKINRESRFLAYPFGSFNEKVKVLAGNYYKMAFSIDKGRINPDSDLFELKRNSVDSEVTFYQFKHIIKNGRL